MTFARGRRGVVAAAGAAATARGSVVALPRGAPARAQAWSVEDSAGVRAAPFDQTP